MLQVTRYWGPRPRLSTTSAVLAIGLLIALASAGLAACGYNPSNPGSSPSTQPSAQVTHPPAQVQKCGIVQGLGRLKVPVGVDTSDQQAENCFWQAFQHCQPATLVFVTSSVDTALTRTFTISNHNGTCSISDTLQQRIASNTPSPAGTYTCAGLTQKSGGLLFSACGQDGDVFVPGS